jgi:hypothetical protein
LSSIAALEQPSKTNSPAQKLTQNIKRIDIDIAAGRAVTGCFHTVCLIFAGMKPLAKPVQDMCPSSADYLAMFFC